jgi:hypothetical protein
MKCNFHTFPRPTTDYIVKIFEEQNSKNQLLRNNKHSHLHYTDQPVNELFNK